MRCGAHKSEALVRGWSFFWSECETMWCLLKRRVYLRFALIRGSMVNQNNCTVVYLKNLSCYLNCAWLSLMICFSFHDLNFDCLIVRFYHFSWRFKSTIIWTMPEYHWNIPSGLSIVSGKFFLFAYFSFTSKYPPV